MSSVCQKSVCLYAFWDSTSQDLTNVYGVVGFAMPIEIQVYLAKFMPDPRRAEPRNVGLVVRTATDEILTKFLLEEEKTVRVPKKLDLMEFASTVGEWRKALDKYGIKALSWIGKRKKSDQRLYLEFMGGELVHELDFDKLFEELVL